MKSLTNVHFHPQAGLRLEQLRLRASLLITVKSMCVTSWNSTEGRAVILSTGRRFLRFRLAGETVTIAAEWIGRNGTIPVLV
jgi:hypothetical protein